MPFQTMLDPFAYALQAEGAQLQNEALSIQNQTKLSQLGLVKAKMDLMKEEATEAKTEAQRIGFKPDLGMAGAGDTDAGGGLFKTDGISASALMQAGSKHLKQADKWGAIDPAEADRRSALADREFTAAEQAFTREGARKQVFFKDLIDIANTAQKGPAEAIQAMDTLKGLYPDVSMPKLMKMLNLQPDENGNPRYNKASWENVSHFAINAKTAMEEENKKEQFRLQQLREDRANKELKLKQQREDRLDATARDGAEAKEAAREAKKESAEAKKQTAILEAEKKLAKEYNTQSKEFIKEGGIRKSYETAERYFINPKTGEPYHTGHFDSSGDQGLTYAFISSVHPEHRAAVADMKNIGSLSGIPEHIFQGIKSLVNGKELPERVRKEMFQAVKERFNTSNEFQRKLEEQKKYELRMTNPNVTDEDIAMLVPEYSIKPRALSPSGGLDYFLNKHGGS